VRNRLSLAGLVIVSFFVFISLAAPLLVGAYPNPLDPNLTPFLPPSAAHPLGTDQQGFDNLKLLVYGGRVSLLIGLAASLVAMVVGTTVGLVAGYYGRSTDQVLSRTTDFFLVIPWLPFVIILVALLGPGLVTVIVAIAVVSWPTTARVIRSQVLTVKERGFIRRARAFGASNGYIIRKHILPTVLPLVWAESVLTISGAIFTEAFLSFFGLGWSGPGAIESWGQMVNYAYTWLALLTGAWWWFAPPGISITALVLGFAMLGYGLEEILNPRLRKR
jgi:peptide/nickel transport system permease protein